jgi:hypothetical protein
MSDTTRYIPPAQTAVKPFGALDIGNGDDDDLELHIAPRRAASFNRHFASHLGVAYPENFDRTLRMTARTATQYNCTKVLMFSDPISVAIPVLSGT